MDTDEKELRQKLREKEYPSVAQEEQTFGINFCSLHCDTCAFNECKLHYITNGNTNYRDACASPNFKLETDFIKGFMRMLFHDVHLRYPEILDQKMIWIAEDGEGRLVNTDFKVTMSSNVNQVLSLLFGRDHYCAMDYYVPQKIITIIDGANYDLETWEQGIKLMLEELSFISSSDSVTFREVNVNKTDLFVNDKHRLTIVRGYFVDQLGGTICGVLACMYILVQVFDWIDPDKYHEFLDQANFINGKYHSNKMEIVLEGYQVWRKAVCDLYFGFLEMYCEGGSGGIHQPSPLQARIIKMDSVLSSRKSNDTNCNNKGDDAGTKTSFLPTPITLD
jgi:hypothetical protein